jgi:hypothetical protein
MLPSHAVRLLIGIVSIASLSSCGTFITYSGAERQDSDVAIVEGYYRNYLLYMAEGKITAVDGVRPSNILQETYSASLLPGTHWIEITDDRYFGGSHGGTVCAVEFDFKAGFRYQLQVGSLQSKTSWLNRGPGQLYEGSAAFMISAPGLTDEMRLVDTTCNDGGGSLCRQVSDCVPHPDMRCIPQRGFSFGHCGFE